ncbi:glutamine amidotransferase [Nocardioides gansuensis]|uniref:Glutamine amidotransferase n=1 Tax=Nocardioides gansuensis TaxID=2138300 RepID=A0A2T8F7V4_9ACTN|nr:glutamine amidotransferase [Nocardioides gansuensis]PVG81785.1 glutamine amidotransferase [Nocardioides gansuensis]
MKPFLMLATRAEDQAADDEYDAMLRWTGLDEGSLQRVRLESAPMPALDLASYSGVILGGGPFDASAPTKSAVQLRVEAELRTLLDTLVERDFPFLGACYGVGTLGVHQGVIVDKTYGEPIGVVPVTLTEAGREDPVLAGMPATFDAFVGHKEACRDVPPGAVLLASSPACPVQMFRVRTNLYATQFHPELDVDGIVTRIKVYQHYGYYPPETMDEIISRVSQELVTWPPRILTNFVARYA